MGLSPTIADAAGLRDVLDRLASAIRKPSFTSASSGIIPVDRARLLASLSAVLSALPTTGSTPVLFRSTLAGSVEFGRLQSILEPLRLASARRLSTRIGPEKLRLLTDLLFAPAPDLLGVLNRTDDENAHSDVLRWLFDPHCAPAIAPAALRGLANVLPDSPSWLRAFNAAIVVDAIVVRREVVFSREQFHDDDLARVDLLISGPDFVLAIENKLWSREHDDQTKAYWGWFESLSGLRGGVFLSPFGLPASSEQFVPMSYLDLLDSLLEGALDPIKLTESEWTVLAGYAKTLAASALRTELRSVLRKGH